MSRKTDSPETAITVPSICFLPASALREWLCSYWEKISSNDSLGSVLGWDSGILGLDMRGYTFVVMSPTRITPCPPIRCGGGREGFRAINEQTGADQGYRCQRLICGSLDSQTPVRWSHSSLAVQVSILCSRMETALPETDRNKLAERIMSAHFQPSSGTIR